MACPSSAVFPAISPLRQRRPWPAGCHRRCRRLARLAASHCALRVARSNLQPRRVLPRERPSRLPRSRSLRHFFSKKCGPTARPAGDLRAAAGVVTGCPLIPLGHRLHLYPWRHRSSSWSFRSKAVQRVRQAFHRPLMPLAIGIEAAALPTWQQCQQASPQSCGRSRGCNADARRCEGNAATRYRSRLTLAKQRAGGGLEPLVCAAFEQAVHSGYDPGIHAADGAAWQEFRPSRDIALDAASYPKQRGPDVFRRQRIRDCMISSHDVASCRQHRLRRM